MRPGRDQFVWLEDVDATARRYGAESAPHLVRRAVCQYGASAFDTATQVAGCVRHPILGSTVPYTVPNLLRLQSGPPPAAVACRRAASSAAWALPAPTSSGTPAAP